MLLRFFVSRGASWLDRYDPTWHQRIEAQRLADDNSVCVLGQLYGNAAEFIETRYLLPPLETIDTLSRGRQVIVVPRFLAALWFFVSRGFMPVRDPESVWRRLWEEEILARQVGTSAPVEQRLAELDEAEFLTRR